MTNLAATSRVVGRSESGIVLGAIGGIAATFHRSKKAAGRAKDLQQIPRFGNIFRGNPQMRGMKGRLKGNETL
jgi:hypothetical protein